MGVKRLGDKVWVVDAADKLAIVSYVDTDKYNADRQVGAVMNVSTEVGIFPIRYWGKNNCQPQEREALVKENPLVGELLKAKRNLALGSGLVAYRKKFENGEETKEFVEIPSDIEAWMKKTKFKQFLRTAGKNLEFHGNFFPEAVRDKGGKIYSVECKECNHVRMEKKDGKGRVNNFFWCGNWKSPGKKSGGEEYPVYRIPAYDDSEGAPKQPKFMLHYGDDFLSDGYYYVPAWWGGRFWITLANVIPLFHLNNLKHGYVVRWHVEIPEDYFFDYLAAQQATKDDMDKLRENAEAAEQEFLDKMNAFFAGLENTGRAIFSKSKWNKAMGKEYPGIKITPLNFDMKDEALLKLLDEAVRMLISGQGIHPTLANVESQGKLSSGSEVRNSYLFYLAIKTPAARDILIEFVEFIHQEMGWPDDLHWWFKDIELTKLDENPNGNQPAIMK